MNRDIKDIISDIETAIQCYEDNLCEEDIDLTDLSVDDLKNLVDYVKVTLKNTSVELL